MTPREGVLQERQRREDARDPHVLARGAGLEPDPIGEPGRTRPVAGVPAEALVELADEGEQPCGGRADVRGQLGELVAESFELVAGNCGG